MEDYPSDEPEIELTGDPGLALRIREQVENMGQWVRTHSELAVEPVRAVSVNPAGLFERSVSAAKRHKKLALGLSGTALASLGFTTGAWASSHHRHAH
jgi:hypothetical protein